MKDGRIDHRATGKARAGVHEIPQPFNIARVATNQRSKRQRVAPLGSAVATPKAVWNRKRYTSQGGGPALGAL